MAWAVCDTLYIDRLHWEPNYYKVVGWFECQTQRFDSCFIHLHKGDLATRWTRHLGTISLYAVRRDSANKCFCDPSRFLELTSSPPEGNILSVGILIPKPSCVSGIPFIYLRLFSISLVWFITSWFNSLKYKNNFIFLLPTFLNKVAHYHPNVSSTILLSQRFWSQEDQGWNSGSLTFKFYDSRPVNFSWTYFPHL